MLQQRPLPLVAAATLSCPTLSPVRRHPWVLGERAQQQVRGRRSRRRNRLCLASRRARVCFLDAAPAFRSQIRRPQSHPRL